MAFRSANPTLGENTFEKFERDGKFRDMVEGRQMTVAGTANRTGILLLLATLSGAFTWNLMQQGQPAFGWMLGGLLGGFIVSLVLMFRPTAAPILAPVYAALEGLFLGAISFMYQRAYSGIVPQAIGLTIGVMAVMLVIYRSGLIKVTEKFKVGLFAATGGVALFYVATMFARMFGASWGNVMWQSSPLSIGLSLLVVGIAALNLVWDFDIIEQGVRRGAPKWMEWYGAYGLMVTLVWLYLELLRLLAKLNRR